MWTDDPVADYHRYDRERQKRLDSLPKCDRCKEPIQESSYYLINDEKICSDCIYDHLDEYYKVKNEEF